MARAEAHDHEPNDRIYQTDANVVAGEAEIVAVVVSRTLDEIIGDAVSENPRVRSQRSVAAAAHYDADAARWEYYPSPALTTETSTLSRGLTDRQVNFSVTQPLYAFGRIEAGVKSASARAQAADFGIEESRFAVSARVLDAYAQYAGARRALQVFEADIKRLGALEEMIKSRVAAGISAPVDYNLVASRLGQSQNAVTSLTAQMRSAAEALSQLSGSPLSPNSIEVPDSRTTDIMVAAAQRTLARDDVLRRTLEVSPLLMRAGSEIEVARADKRRARSSLLPTIFARFEHRESSGGYNVSPFPDTRVVVGSQLTFGAGLSAIERVRSFSEQEAALIANREAAKNDVTATVVADFEAWQAARRLVVSLRSNRAIQVETSDSYNRMFLAGKRGWLDVLNVVREQTQIERDLADAEVQVVVRGYRLMLSTGQLAWQAAK